MNTLLHAIQLAGAFHLVIAAANFILPAMLRYRENLEKVSTIIRQIFCVHADYIVLVLVGFGLVSLLFPAELAGASPLGRFMAAFLALFWGSRVVVQLTYYDAAIKREHPCGNIFFLLVFIYLTVVFAVTTFCAL